MYRVVTGIIARESDNLDMYVETNNNKVKEQNADHGRTRPDFRGRGYGTTANSIVSGDICLTQMSARKGIKLFGERAVVAILKEFAQLDEMGVVEPLDPDKLTAQQKKDALRTVSLLKLNNQYDF